VTAAAALIVPVYHPGESQRCPACHGRAWRVGRTTAECARCAAALPLASTPLNGAFGAPETPHSNQGDN
jgi:hypothetical protein